MIENKIFTEETLLQIKNLKGSCLVSLFGNYQIRYLPENIVNIFNERNVIPFPVYPSILENYIEKGYFLEYGKSKLANFEKTEETYKIIYNFKKIQNICKESFLKLTIIELLNLFEQHKDEFANNKEVKEFIFFNQELLNGMKNCHLELFENKQEITLLQKK